MVTCRGPPHTKACGRTCINNNYRCRVQPAHNANDPPPGAPPGGAGPRARKQWDDLKCRPGNIPCGGSCINPQRRTCRKQRPGGADAAAPPPPPVPPRAGYSNVECESRAETLRDLQSPTPQTARRAWVRASLACHPDKGGSTADQQCVNYFYNDHLVRMGRMSSRDRGNKPAHC